MKLRPRPKPVNFRKIHGMSLNYYYQFQARGVGLNTMLAIREALGRKGYTVYRVLLTKKRAYFYGEVCLEPGKSLPDCHLEIQAIFKGYPLITRWKYLDFSRWDTVYKQRRKPKKSKAQHVSAETYARLYAEREAELDMLPGGAQGAHPDMSDVRIKKDEEGHYVEW